MRGCRRAAEQKQEAFSSELKAILEKKDSKCSMRPKPAYTEENTSGNLCISEETVNKRSLERSALVICDPAAGLVTKPDFLYPSLNPRGIKGQT